MAKQKKESWDIEKAALKGVKKDFSRAAKAGHKSVSKAFLDADQVIKQGRSVMSGANHRVNYALENLRFLQSGSKGEFLRSRTNFSSHLTGMPVWDEYLDSLGRRDHAPGCAVRTRKEVQHLMEQNGPKKMQQRLEGFVKRKIKQAEKGCTL